jgi:hypothetical protein
VNGDRPVSVETERDGAGDRRFRFTVGTVPGLWLTEGELVRVVDEGLAALHAARLDGERVETRVFSVRVDATALARIRQAALSVGVSPSEFVRQAALTRATAVLDYAGDEASGSGRAREGETE